MSEKRGLLPIVNEGIGDSILVDYKRNTNYAYDIANRLQEDNPTVLKFIGLMSSQSPKPKLIAETALIVYRLLESQAEADQMKR